VTRGYSAALATEIHATSSGDPPLALLEITHSGLTTPVRVINDTQSLVSNGNTYIALGFGIVLPDEREGQLPRAQLAIDNIGRELMQWLDTSNGGAGAQARLMQVRRSAPDTVEYDITLDVVSVRATAKIVTCDLGFESFLDRPAVLTRYDPLSAPGVFGWLAAAFLTAIVELPKWVVNLSI
jgi:hypothetical protein